jgi:hypothetical protein
MVLSAQTWVELPPDARPYFELELAQNHDLIISGDPLALAEADFSRPYLSLLQQKLAERLDMPVPLLEGDGLLWAQVPMGRCHCPFHSHTRSPIRLTGTPSPMASITPAPSLCGTISGSLTGRARLDLTSEGFTPEVARRTSTSPACGLGVGKSPTCITSWASPLRLYQAAFMKGLLELEKMPVLHRSLALSLSPVECPRGRGNSKRLTWHLL